MKNLIIVVIICILIGALLQLGLTNFFHVAAELSAQIASIPVVAIPFICEELKKQDLRISNRRDQTSAYLPTFEDYLLNWYLMLLFASMLFLAIPNLTTVIALLLNWCLFDSKDSSVIQAIDTPLILFSAYYAGRWVGRRSGRGGIWILLTSLLIGSAIWRIIDYVVTPANTFLSLTGQEKNFSSYCFLLAGGYVIFLIPSLIGFLRGRYKRWTGYLNYLLSLLPSETRETIIGLTYEEACRMIKR